MEEDDYRAIIAILLEVIHDSSHDPVRVHHLTKLAIFLTENWEDTT